MPTATLTIYPEASLTWTPIPSTTETPTATVTETTMSTAVSDPILAETPTLIPFTPPFIPSPTATPRSGPLTQRQQQQMTLGAALSGWSYPTVDCYAANIDDFNNCFFHTYVDNYHRLVIHLTGTEYLVNQTYYLSNNVAIIGELGSSDLCPTFTSMMDSTNSSRFLYLNGGKTLLLANVCIKNFTTNAAGGAIYVPSSAQLALYKVSMISNQATGGGGGAIATTGNPSSDWSVSIWGSTFKSNSANGNGGAIDVHVFGSVEIECTTFETNKSFNQGGAIDFTQYADPSYVMNSNFKGNEDADPNVGSNALYAQSSVNAENNWWTPGGGIVQDHAGVVVTAVRQSAITLGAVPCQAPPASRVEFIIPTPNMPPTPTLTPTTAPTTAPTVDPRRLDVATQALDFQMHAEQFGLPLPFDSWPIADGTEITWKQGYGPTGYTYGGKDIGVYKNLHNIHPGIDFSGGPNNKTVISVCDGVVVGGKTTKSPGDFGISIMCFLDEKADPDNDGIRNLSNIVVSYNHLNSQVIPNGYIVLKGEPIGNTMVSVEIGGNKNDHLHLEMYLAYGKNGAEDIRINPLLMFNSNIVNRFLQDDSEQSVWCRKKTRLYPYFPIVRYVESGQECDEKYVYITRNSDKKIVTIESEHFEDSLALYGLLEGDISFLSEEASLPDKTQVNATQVAQGNVFGNQNFETFQIATPTSVVEWWPADETPRLVDNLTDFLLQYTIFKTQSFVSPNWCQVMVNLPLEDQRSKACVPPYILNANPLEISTPQP